MPQHHHGRFVDSLLVDANWLNSEKWLKLQPFNQRQRIYLAKGNLDKDWKYLSVI